jgi:hypothetical protein
MAVHEAISSLSTFDLLGGYPSWELFLECLEEKLKSLGLQSRRAGRGVRVMDVMSARGEGFKVLFLVGLKEKLFPRLVSEDPFLSDKVRQALRHPAGYWIMRKAAGIEEERLLFYLMVSSARERLYCIYPRSDESGKAEVPSLYLRELCRASGVCLSDPGINHRIPRQPVQKLKACAPGLLSPGELSLRLSLEGRNPAAYLDLVGKDSYLLESCLEAMPSFNSWGRPGGRDGLVGPPRKYLKELLRRGLSPSALESFAQCPFQFFADRVLGLGRRHEAARKGEFADWVKGRIYHEILERFYSGLKNAPSSGFWENELEKTVDLVFRERNWKEMGVYPLLWVSVRETMTFHLKSFVKWNMAETQALGLEPSWFEKELCAPLPVGLPKPIKGLQIHGIIDRVDLDGVKRRYRVVDYKTRLRSRMGLTDRVAKGELCQLPFYAELVGHELGEGWGLESACLHSIEDSPEISARARSQVYEGEQWDRGREPFFSWVAGELGAIAQGRFPIRPNDGDFGYCVLCDFSSLCRKNHAPSRWRAATAADSPTTAFPRQFQSPP